MRTDPAPRPARVTLEGRSIDLVPLDADRHGESIYESTRGPEHDALWAYLFDGPFESRADFDRSMQRMAKSEDPLYYAIIDRASHRAVGRAALMRIEPAHRVIEVGSTRDVDPLAARERETLARAVPVPALEVRDGDRPVERRVQRDGEDHPAQDSTPASRSAALRLGFTFEGVFRQHMIIKGKSRDTAWYSMIDSEWPARKARLESWLAPENFDASGRQRTALSAM